MMVWRTGRAAAAAVIGALALTGCIRFGAPTTHPVPLAATETVWSLEVGDVTGDGLDDLLLGIEDSQSSVLKTRVMHSCGADCTTPGTLIEGWHPVTVADFDSDGFDDVVVSSAQFYEGDARVYFGGPAAGARPAGLAPDDWIPLPPGWGYTTGDLDGDGDVDLIGTTTVQLYYLEHRHLRNDGARTFTDAGLLTYSGPLNESGGGVLVVGVGTRDHVYGRWLGEWLPADPSSPSGLPADAFHAADIDGDGIDDLLVSPDDVLTFWRGTGTGFAPFSSGQTIDVPQLTGWHVRDLNADGDADLALLDRQNGATILTGSGNGDFPYKPVGEIPPGRVVFGDLDGDGPPEAISIAADSLGIEIFPNTAVT